MKKLFVIVSTPFWMVNIDFTPALELKPIGNLRELRQVCHDFSRTVESESDKAAFDFFRRQAPVYFSVRETTPSEKKISLAADTSTLELTGLTMKKNTLSEKAAQLGLPSAGAIVENREGAVFLKVTGLDLACDLVAHRLEVRAKTQLKAGPPPAEMSELMQRLETIEQAILQARNIKNPQLAAVVLGVSLEPDDLKLAFEKLISPQTMELSENWEYFGGVPSIKYELWKDAGLTEVRLVVPYLHEQALKDIEKKLAAFSQKPAAEFSSDQRAEFSALNRQRAELLRNRILQKLRRKNYAR